MGLWGVGVDIYANVIQWRRVLWKEENHVEWMRILWIRPTNVSEATSALPP